MLRHDAELVFQVRAKQHRIDALENGVDCLRNFYGPGNVAISRVTPSIQDPEVLICFVSVFNLGQRREPRVASWDPYQDPNRCAEAKRESTHR